MNPHLQLSTITDAVKLKDFFSALSPQMEKLGIAENDSIRDSDGTAHYKDTLRSNKGVAYAVSVEPSGRDRQRVVVSMHWPSRLNKRFATLTPSQLLEQIRYNISKRWRV